MKEGYSEMIQQKLLDMDYCEFDSIMKDLQTRYMPNSKDTKNTYKDNGANKIEIVSPDVRNANKKFEDGLNGTIAFD
jgi:hypothetical protein